MTAAPSTVVSIGTRSVYPATRSNVWQLHDDHALVWLLPNFTAFCRVDLVDVQRLSPFRWTISRGRRVSYASAAVHVVDGKRTNIQMHRLLMAEHLKPGQDVDHINHDGLDCRRANLRTCTRRQNAANQLKYAEGRSSQFKGVTRDGERWVAQIVCAGKAIHLGTFDTEVDAAYVYDAAARRKFGSFACVNFPLAGEIGAHQDAPMAAADVLALMHAEGGGA